MPSEHLWRIHVRNLETRIKIGVHSYEKEPQRVIVNATVEGRYKLKPVTLADTFDYEVIPNLVLKEWPTRPHAWLLEGCVVELLTYIFAHDARVTFARVSCCKPDIIGEAESVGVEAEWTRADYERLAKK